MEKLHKSIDRSLAEHDDEPVKQAPSGVAIRRSPRAHAGPDALREMTVADLIATLSAYPSDARVALLDQERRWLLPIQVMQVSATTDVSRELSFVAITADRASDELEGIAHE